MKILSLETTDPIGSVAAFEDGKLLLELDLNSKQRSAQSLAPAIKLLLDQLDWTPNDVNLVAVTTGPGSFTGLRVGVTMAKTFAYAIGAEVIGINTLETIAHAAPASISALTTVIDAQRSEIVSRSFARDADNNLQPTDKEHLVSVDKWLGELTPGTIVSGPILKKLLSRLPVNVTAIEEKYWSPRAGTVAKLAFQYYSAGRRDDLWALLPHYSRLSAAEERLQAKAK